jgi:hypothetical protein
MLDITELMMLIRERSGPVRSSRPLLNSRLSLVIVTTVVLGIASCQSSEPDELTEYSQNAGAPAEVGSSGVDVSESPQPTDSEPSQPEPLCPLNNQTRQCTCDKDGEVVQGRQVCYTTRGWGACECAEIPSTVITTNDAGVAADPVNNKGPEHFDWSRTVPSGGSCKAGHYEGDFEGEYIPSFSFGFAVSNVSGTMGFDLVETGKGEFLEISGGHMAGVAEDYIPFEGDIVGTVDCAAGYTDAYLRNCYYLMVIVPTSFEGPLLAHYDKINHAFINGVWSVTEPDANGVYPTPLGVSPGDPLPSLSILAIFGGVGSWKATLVP